MGQTWNEFRRQCKLIGGIFGSLPALGLDPKDELTVDLLKIIASKFFPKNGLKPNGLKPERIESDWVELFDYYRSKDQTTVADVSGVIERHRDWIEKKNHDQALDNALLLRGTPYSKTTEGAKKFALAEQGIGYSQIGMLRLCLRHELGFV